MKVILQGNLFQKSTHLLYCSVLSVGGNVNTRRMLYFTNLWIPLYNENSIQVC